MRSSQKVYAESLCRPKSRVGKFTPIKTGTISRETCFTGLNLKKMQAGMPF
jgi:hypothetical protein